PVGLNLGPNTGIVSGIPAPGTCGPWTVMVTCADNATCGGPGCCPPVTAPLYLFVDCWAYYSGMTTTYSTTACDFTVNIGPGLVYGTTNVLIDGSPEATLGGNGSETFTSVPCESHLVVVDQIVQGPDPKTRYSCSGSNQKWVSDIDNIAYFDYAPDMWIDTGREPAGVAQPPNAGFYAAGANFSTTAPSPVPSNSQAVTKYIYRAWSLPDGSTNPNRDLWFIVDRAGTAMAEYDTYYLLNIVSDYPSFSDSTWELKDSTATYNVALQEVPTPNFWGIIGGVMRPMNASGTHVMTGPYTQKIEWFYDYTIPIILISVIVLLIVGLVVFLVLRRKGPGASAVPAAPVAQAPQPPAAATEAAKTTPVVAATVEKKALTEAETTDKPNFCPKCGASVEKDATFCKKCGKKLV
ncbi:MAG: zinc ribbon domain-containing protein, partial [Chloroflexi bacterium]|nr:zinc ribbon domain-containing protein [Chloroflexota bacterium]